MPRPRFEKMDADKRRKIIETAAQEFAAHGFEGASLNHILAEAGISKGAAYYYFDGKADLYAAVLIAYWDHIRAHVDLDIERLDRDTFWTKLEEMYRQSAAHAVEQPWILPLAKAVWKWPAVMEGKESVPAPLLEFKEWVRALLVKGQEVGAIRRDLPFDLLFALVAAVDDAGDRWCLEHGAELEPSELVALSSRLLDMMRQMVAPPEVRE